MIDARQQIGTALQAVTPNVKMSRPDGDIELPLICYAETGNIPVNMAYTRLKWRVAVYAGSFTELVELTNAADHIMSDEIGFTRTGKTPDDKARIGTDLYLCRLDYSGLVNNETLGVIKYSK